MKDDKGIAGKTLLRNLYRILLLKPKSTKFKAYVPSI